MDEFKKWDEKSRAIRRFGFGGEYRYCGAYVLKIGKATRNLLGFALGHMYMQYIRVGFVTEESCGSEVGIIAFTLSTRES